MLNADILIGEYRLQKETANAIILKIMDSLHGLNISVALTLLNECKKEVYTRAMI